jgi:hypothetical protein
VFDVQFGNALRAAKRVSFQEEPERENGLVLGNVHRVERAAVGLGIGLEALGAAKTAQSVAVFAKALASDLASIASHCYIGFCLANHAFIYTATASC